MQILHLLLRSVVTEVMVVRRMRIKTVGMLAKMQNTKKVLNLRKSNPSKKINKRRPTMPAFNKVILMGNLTRDPEIKFLTSGTPVTNFGIAVSEKYTKDGEQKESVCFVEVEAWDKQAETIDEYFEKGDPIFIEGALKFEQWEDEDLKKRSKLKVRLQRFQFLRYKGGGDSEGPAVAAKDSEDDIPF